jgi:hypothetical protein
LFIAIANKYRRNKDLMVTNSIKVKRPKKAENLRKRKAFLISPAMPGISEKYNQMQRCDNADLKKVCSLHMRRKRSAGNQHFEMCFDFCLA